MMMMIITRVPYPRLDSMGSVPPASKGCFISMYVYRAVVIEKRSKCWGHFLDSTNPEIDPALALFLPPRYHQGWSMCNYQSIIRFFFLMKYV